MNDKTLVQRLRALKWQVLCEMRGLVDDTTAYEAADTIEAQATRIEALEADNARLVKANGLRMDELHKERKEAKLWFERAQEWKARNEALEAALRWIGDKCDEEIPLEYNDAMRKTFQRNIRDFAHKALERHP